METLFFTLTFLLVFSVIINILYYFAFKKAWEYKTKYKKLAEKSANFELLYSFMDWEDEFWPEPEKMIYDDVVEFKEEERIKKEKKFLGLILWVILNNINHKIGKSPYGDKCWAYWGKEYETLYISLAPEWYKFYKEKGIKGLFDEMFYKYSLASLYYTLKECDEIDGGWESEEEDDEEYKGLPV